MMNRTDRILDTLSLRVRALTTAQAMRMVGIEDDANWRRFSRSLLREGLIRPVQSAARPPPPMVAPLATWGPGDLVPDFGQVIYRASLRERGVPAMPVACLVATGKVRRLYGAPGDGHLARPTQLSHDLMAAGCFVSGVLAGRFAAEDWIGEDRVGRLGERLPDAMLLGPGGEGRTVLEIVGGDYESVKIAEIHRACECLGLRYELW